MRKERSWVIYGSSESIKKLKDSVKEQLLADLNNQYSLSYTDEDKKKEIAETIQNYSKLTLEDVYTAILKAKGLLSNK